MPSAYHTKKLLVLSAVGIALALIPRRSSKRSDQPLSQHFGFKDQNIKDCGTKDCISKQGNKNDK